jgi:D-alanine-D-alanine ligase
VLIDRRSARAEETDAAVSVTGLAIDVVFPVLHGPYGEDGTIQGLLELANLPYVGCGVLASAVGMDKGVMKTIFRAEGLRVPDWLIIRRGDWQAQSADCTRRIESTLGYPVFVKPANMGSSVGISKVHGAHELGAAMALALGFDTKVIVEAAVPNAREIECAVLGNDAPQASVAGEIVPSREFYDYDAKYIDAGSRLEIPAALDAAMTAEVQRLAVRAFQTIEGSGLARVDFLLDRDSGDLFVNEINTLPGFTTISMYAKLWAASGVDYATLVDRLIGFARDRHASKQDLRTSVV